MDEKPVRNPDRLAVISQWLGTLAVLTPPIIGLLWFGFELNELDEDGFFLFCLVPGLCLFSVVCGLAGIITGSVALRRKPGEKWDAGIGIFLGSLAILVAVGTLVYFFALPGWYM